MIEVLPSYLHYIPGSAEVDGVGGPGSEPIISDGSQTLTWYLGSMSVSDVHSIDFEVTVDTPGSNLLMDEYPDSRVDYEDYQGNPQSEEFEEVHLTVASCATPTPTPTPSRPTPTPTPGPRLAAMPTTTATPTPVALPMVAAASRTPAPPTPTAAPPWLALWGAGGVFPMLVGSLVWSLRRRIR